MMERYLPEIDTKDASAIRREALGIFHRLFPGSDDSCIQGAFDWAELAFAGRYADYQAIDAKYHDFEHTLQGTLCFVRLLEGYFLAKAMPPLTAREFEIGLVSILLHDTGYLKKNDDNAGTGAKYTLTHVTRSAEFAAALLRDKGFSPSEIRAVQNMIRCTGVNADLQSIPFQNDQERVIGYALGTADLLGQMAATDYIDKLGILFQEFEESNRYNGKPGGAGPFASVEDLRKKTPAFWEKYVVPKIHGDFKGLYRFLALPDGSNPYLRQIESNISRLREQLEAQS